VSAPRVLLATLSIRTSARGNTYLSGWLGKAQVVGFPGEADKYGNATWDLFVSEPALRGDPPAGASSRPVSRPRPRPGDSDGDFDDVDQLGRIGR
jgi:hypothetical protein